MGPLFKTVPFVQPRLLIMAANETTLIQTRDDCHDKNIRVEVIMKTSGGVHDGTIKMHLKRLSPNTWNQAEKRTHPYLWGIGPSLQLEFILKLYIQVHLKVKAFSIRCTYHTD